MQTIPHTQVMKVGYLELVTSHLAGIRRAKNKNGEAALDRCYNALMSITPEDLLAKGKSTEKSS